MADFTGEYDGYTYVGTWERASAGRVTWTAAVRHSGELMGSPSGKIDGAGLSDSDAEVAVMVSVDSSIQDGVSVRRK